MADLNKFEQMLERLVNEDRAGAEELFHEIVVEKSRDIYEALLEADLEDDEVDEASDEEDDVDESSHDDDEDDDKVDEEELDEDFNLDEFEVEADPMAAMMGGDKTDDMMGGMEVDADDEDDEDDEGVEGRIDDLEDALDELKAEFEAMMAGDEGDEGSDDNETDMDDEEGGDADDMDMDDEEPEEESFQATITPMTAGETMREYVEKVSGGGLDASKIGGDNGANAKSTVAGKNDMGGTTANLRGGESKGEGTAGGLASNKPQAMNTKNVNVPGAKGATKMSNQPGHGAEKKGKPETADKSAGSMLNGAPKRAK